MKAEGKLSLTIRTATRDRQATITAPMDATVGEILSSACENWNLAGDRDYAMRCERLNSQLAESVTLQQAGIVDGDVLEIQTMADAGDR